LVKFGLILPLRNFKIVILVFFKTTFKTIKNNAGIVEIDWDWWRLVEIKTDNLIKVYLNGLTLAHNKKLATNAKDNYFDRQVL
jgi:hypothetical protein